MAEEGRNHHRTVQIFEAKCIGEYFSKLFTVEVPTPNVEVVSKVPRK